MNEGKDKFEEEQERQNRLFPTVAGWFGNAILVGAAFGAFELTNRYMPFPGIQTKRKIDDFLIGRGVILPRKPKIDKDHPPIEHESIYQPRHTAIGSDIPEIPGLFGINPTEARSVYIQSLRKDVEDALQIIRNIKLEGEGAPIYVRQAIVDAIKTMTTGMFPGLPTTGIQERIRQLSSRLDGIANADINALTELEQILIDSISAGDDQILSPINIQTTLARNIKNSVRTNKRVFDPRKVQITETEENLLAEAVAMNKRISLASNTELNRVQHVLWHSASSASYRNIVDQEIINKNISTNFTKEYSRLGTNPKNKQNIKAIIAAALKNTKGITDASIQFMHIEELGNGYHHAVIRITVNSITTGQPQTAVIRLPMLTSRNTFSTGPALYPRSGYHIFLEDQARAITNQDQATRWLMADMPAIINELREGQAERAQGLIDRTIAQRFLEHTNVMTDENLYQQAIRPGMVYFEGTFDILNTQKRRSRITLANSVHAHKQVMMAQKAGPNVKFMHVDVETISRDPGRGPTISNPQTRIYQITATVTSKDGTRIFESKTWNIKPGIGEWKNWVTEDWARQAGYRTDTLPGGTSAREKLVRFIDKGINEEVAFKEFSDFIKKHDNTIPVTHFGTGSDSERINSIVQTLTRATGIDFDTSNLRI